jgi:putative membrane protein
MRRNSRAAMVALGLTLALGTGALGQNNGTGATGQSQLSAPDRQFMSKAAQGGLAEVQLGQLAAQKASNDAVKQFGQRMVQDHSKGNDELKALADREGVSLPTRMSRSDQKTYNRLSRLSGQQFDRAYSRDMVADHQKDVREFEREAQSGKDPEVKAWAANTLKVLQEHLRMARDIETATVR